MGGTKARSCDGHSSLQYPALGTVADLSLTVHIPPNSSVRANLCVPSCLCAFVCLWELPGVWELVDMVCVCGEEEEEEDR